MGVFNELGSAFCFLLAEYAALLVYFYVRDLIRFNILVRKIERLQRMKYADSCSGMAHQ